jgi:hypothetical protein
MELWLILNPSNSNASPFGWHDTDGAVGPEYTITREIMFGLKMIFLLQKSDSSFKSDGDYPFI